MSENSKDSSNLHHRIDPYHKNEHEQISTTTNQQLSSYQRRHMSINKEEEEETDDRNNTDSSLTTCDNISKKEANDHMVYASLGLFALMGMGTLFPYNALITCIDWFTFLHPNARNIAGRLATSTFVSLLITTLLLLPLTQKQSPPPPSSSQKMPYDMERKQQHTGMLQSLLRRIFFKSTNRIAIGFILEALLILSFAFIEPSVPTALTLSFFVGVGDAIAQSGVYVYAATIDVRCSAAVAFGSAAAGLCVSCLRIVTKAAFDESGDERESSAVFFVLCSLVVGVCLVALVVAVNLEERIRDAFMVSNNDRGEVISTTDPHDSDIDINNESDHPTNNNKSLIFFFDVSVYQETLMVTWRPTLAVFFNFFITLSLFPGTITSMQSTQDRGLRDWLPVVLITIFNLFDCIGRAILTSKRFSTVFQGEQLPCFKYLIGLPTLGRVLFFPLISMCVNPLYISSDAIRCGIVALFAITNGYVFAACYMVGPVMMIEDGHKDAASLMMLLATYLGLMLGGFFGMFWDTLLQT